MPLLISTYRHDYTPPLSIKVEIGSAAAHNPCDCCAAKTKPPNVLQQADDCCIAPTSENAEWTGIAPMGALIKPRIIPVSEVEDDDRLIDACSTDKPNRFLANVHNANPGLYESLKLLNNDDLLKRLDANRLMTTYQVDYCRMKEYSEGLYMEDEADKAALMDSLFTVNDPCGDESVIKEQAKPCPRVSIKRTKVCCKHCDTKKEATVPLGHWKATDKIESEYTATVGRIGDFVMKFNINNHSKCKTEDKCKHMMKLQ